VDERFCSNPIEVLVIDDRHLAGMQPPDQILGAAVDPCRANSDRLGRLGTPRDGHQLRPRGERILAAEASSSSACWRAVALSGWPDSMRESSTTRPLLPSVSAVATVRPSLSSLETAIW